MRLLRFNTLLLIFTSFISHLYAQSVQLNAPLPVDSLITIGKFSNGLTYYIRKNVKPEKRAEFRLAVKTGSIMEDDDQQGLAHFVEHMAFNGTKNFPKQELVNFLERTGVRFGPHLNAYTSFDETVYMLQIPTDSIHVIEKAFSILEDWAHNISFEDKEIDKERGVVGEEWRLGRGASERVNKKHYPVIFYGSKYAERLPIGKKEAIDTATYETLRRFYRDWYRPDLMAVVAVGDFDKQQIENLIKKHFGSIPLRAQPRERMKYTLANHPQTLVSSATDAELQYTTIQYIFKQDEQKEKFVGDYRRQIANRLYDGMFNIRISELMQKPATPFAFAGGGFGKYIGGKEAFTLYVMPKENQIKEATEALLTEMYRVSKHGFTEGELERQKKSLLRGMEKAFTERDKTESDSYADEFIRNYLTEEPIPGIAFEYQLYQMFVPQITLSEINALSLQRITKENRAIIVSAPKKDGLVLPADFLFRIALDEVEQRNIPPYVDAMSDKKLLEKEPKAGKVISEKILKEIGVTEWTLSNGAKVVLKPTDFKNDEILFSATSVGGNSLQSTEKFLSTYLGSSSVTALGGIGDFDMIQLQKYLSGKIANVNPYIYEITEGLNGNCSPKDIETMFQLAYLRFTSPRKDNSAFGAYLSRYKTFIQNRNLSPETAFYDTISTVTSSYHPRTVPPTVELIDKQNLDEAISFYKDRFADASDFTFFIIGSFEIAKVKPLVETYIASLPSLKRKESWKDIGMRFPKGKIYKEIFRGIEPKSSVQISFNGPFEWTRQNRYDFNSMIEVLQIKLREQLREEKGGVYGVGISGSPSLYPRKEYTITVRFGCAPERVEELIGVVHQQIDSLKQFGAQKEYIEKVQELQRRDNEVNVKENNFWISSLNNSYFYGDDPKLILQREKLISALTAAAVQNAAKKYFSTENVATFVLKPEIKN